jgi:sec-independent protein translocase protein TatA
MRTGRLRLREVEIKMGFSVWHLIIAALVALLVFGGSGRISSIMGDVAKGIKSFKKGLAEDNDEKLTSSNGTDYTGSKIPERLTDSRRTRPRLTSGNV